MGTTKTQSMAASPFAVGRERFSLAVTAAPNASRHGSGMSLVGYSITDASQAATAHATQTLAAVRKDDARVPPRGRPL